LIELGAEYRSDWTAIAQMHGIMLPAFHIHFQAGKLVILSEHFNPGAGAVITPRYSAHFPAMRGTTSYFVSEKAHPIAVNRNSDLMEASSSISPADRSGWQSSLLETWNLQRI
jgi:hypothetical protein